jgi:hypothetical protein
MSKIEATMEVVPITKIKIDDTEVFLEDLEPNQGKLTITSFRNNYSTYWGSMGGDLKSFLCRTNSDYFASRLMGHNKDNVMDVRATFTALRKHIADEIMPWYKHMAFQKEMRAYLKDFQRECEGYEGSRADEFFVNMFEHSFANRLDYYLIEDRFDRKDAEEAFKIGEVWNFICTKRSPEFIWLQNLHTKIVKILKKKK